MIDLERIALMRAEEQNAAFNFKDHRDHGDGRRFNGGPRLTERLCVLGCGTRLAHTNTRGICTDCAKTRHREMALERKAGNRTFIGLCSHHSEDGRCPQPIADNNKSGLCSKHRRNVWDRQNRSRAK